jgi:hypothetical protein
LCWIRRDSAEAHAGLTGDGVIAAERRDGRIEAWAISDRDGAPGYLSYLLDDERKQHYLARHGERIVEHWLDGAVHCRWHERLNASPWQFVVRLCPADYALAMIMSDGVASLVDRSGAAVSLGLVLPQLFELKGGRGRFVTRRCKRFFGREAERSGWRHHDDVAVAALTLELS